MTLKEVASALNLRQERTVKGYIRDGLLDAIRLPCGTYRVSAESLRTFLCSLQVIAEPKMQMPSVPKRRHRPLIERGNNKIAFSS